MRRWYIIFGVGQSTVHGVHCCFDVRRQRGQVGVRPDKGSRVQCTVYGRHCSRQHLVVVGQCTMLCVCGHRDVRIWREHYLHKDKGHAL